MEWNKFDGDWDIKDNRLVQKATEGITRCFTPFESKDFIASFDVTLTDKKNENTGEAKFIYSNANSGEEYRVDLMYSAGACRISARNWRYPAPLNLIQGIKYPVKIIVKSNRVTVKVNGMDILERFQFGDVSDGNIGFGTFEASAIFENIEITAFEEKKCFVIMPFDEKRNLLYEKVIKPALELHPTLSFNVTRADEYMTVGKITDDISENIKTADIIIADISKENLNVYYELGYAHACERKAVLLMQKKEGEKQDVPFDIKDFRQHRYQFSGKGFDDLSSKLIDLMTENIS